MSGPCVLNPGALIGLQRKENGMRKTLVAAATAFALVAGTFAALAAQQGNGANGQQQGPPQGETNNNNGNLTEENCPNNASNCQP